MQQAIERKFLVTQLPDLSSIKPTSYERWYISLTQTTEIRVQKKGNAFQLQRKESTETWTLLKQKWIITKEEFQQLKQSAIYSLPILKKAYRLSPTTQISIYEWFLEGLIRAEVEFESIEKAKNYQPEDRMGKEITDEKEGRDRNLYK